MDASVNSLLTGGFDVVFSACGPGSSVNKAVPIARVLLPHSIGLVSLSGSWPVSKSTHRCCSGSVLGHACGVLLVLFGRHRAVLPLVEN
jgi:hypothetical protein